MKSILQLVAVVALSSIAALASLAHDEAAFQELFVKGLNGVPAGVAELDGREVRFLDFHFQQSSGRSNAGIQAVPDYRLLNLRANSSSAAQHCTTGFMRLAMIKTPEQQSAIEYVMAVAGVPGNVWIGGRCVEDFGNYYHTWMDGTRLSVFWNKLALGPAVTCNGKQFRDNLMMFGPNHNATHLIHKWHLEHPEELNYFVCESLVSARSAASNDPFVSGIAGVAPIITEFEGSEVRFLPFVNTEIARALDGAELQAVPDYFVSNLLTNASAADRLCIAEGLAPLSIKTQAEQYNLELAVASTGLRGKIWTSGRCVARGGSTGYWEWNDETRLNIFWNNLLHGPSVECSTDVELFGDRLEMFGSQYTSPYQYKWNSQFQEMRNYVVCQSK